MELSDKVYNKITKLCDKGDRLLEKAKVDKALDKYNKALDLLPEPKEIWEASTWIYVAIGDVYYLLDDYETTLENMFKALNCPDGIGNGFINLRIGQCLYEQDNKDKAKDYLLQAYMIEGQEIFDEETKYFEFIEELIGDEKIIKQTPSNIEFVNNAPKLDECIVIRLEEIKEDAYEFYGNGEYDKSLILFYKMWEILPDTKVEYNESYYLVVDIIDTLINKNDLIELDSWKKIFKLVDINRNDLGDRDFLLGKIEYELNDYESSMSYFKSANKKMYGIVFNELEQKYKDFYLKNK